MTVVDVAALLSATAACSACVLSAINMRRIHTVHLAMNSRLDQLLDANTKIARAVGRDVGIAEERARVKGND